MHALDLLRRLHQHRAWVNGNLLSVATASSEAQLRQPFHIGQESIWNSLVHLYAAEYVWLEALRGDDDPLLPGDMPGKLPGNQQAQGGITGLDDLRQKWAELDERWATYLAALSADSLDELVYKRSTSSNLGMRIGTRRGDVLLHVCTHAHYTAAQVVNMLRQVGVALLPETMLITMARREATSERT